MSGKLIPPTQAVTGHLFTVGLVISWERLNSMNLLLYMVPIAFVFLLPATLFMEENFVGITIALARKEVKIIWYLLFNSSLAYFVNLTNFLVTKHTSALTLQIGA
ncbi:hypothetical protein HPP92_015573 [Vanilla planifolia]|uniref:Sugar phosphate transporter domain-containing protein n=1 Tax=Vanilla planifolia TaxID=51239 RepID=A0A835QMK9_VANPL|nr:hypothetical protein HPP92_015573 [Vanilla planifolia]